MSIEAIHSYQVCIGDEFIYNVKWTILSHLRYMMLSEPLNYIWGEERLSDESFVDSTPARLSSRPLFGVEFMGLERVIAKNTFNEGLVFVISYRSRRGNVRLESEYGTISDSRKLILIHDTIITNFGMLSGENKLEVWDFRSEADIPRKLNKLIKMDLRESSFDMDEVTGERANGVDFVYAVNEG